MREGWNFHNDIAIPLERISNSILGIEKMSCERYTTIFSADFIKGYFSEVLTILLSALDKKEPYDRFKEFMQELDCFEMKKEKSNDDYDFLYKKFLQITKTKE